MPKQRKGSYSDALAAREFVNEFFIMRVVRTVYEV